MAESKSLFLSTGVLGQSFAFRQRWGKGGLVGVISPRHLSYQFLSYFTKPQPSLNLSVFGVF